MSQYHLLEGKISHIYIRYLIPTVIAMATQSLYCLADVFFISKGAGSIGLAALNIAMPIFTFYSAFGLLLGVGSATTIAILEGKGLLHEKQQVFTLTIVTAIVVSIFMTVIGIVFMKDFVLLLGATKALLPYVISYIMPIHLCSVFAVLSYLLQVLVRADRNPNLVMVAMVTSNLMNIVLDYVFVVKLHGGMQGAAIATAIAPILAVVLLSFHYFHQDRSFYFVKSFYSSSLLKRVLSNGLSSALMEISVSVIVIIFNYVILKLGNEVYLAAYAIVTNIAYVCKGIINGFAQAIQPLISTNFGAGILHRVKSSFWTSFLMTTIFGICCYGVMFFMPKTVVSMFSSGEQMVIDIGIRGVLIYFLCLPFMSANTIIMYYFQSIEQFRKATFLTLSRGFLLVLCFLWVFSKLFQMDGVWFSVPVAELVTFIIGFILVLKNMKEHRKESKYVTDNRDGSTQ